MTVETGLAGKDDDGISVSSLRDGDGLWVAGDLKVGNRQCEGRVSGGLWCTRDNDRGATAGRGR